MQTKFNTYMNELNEIIKKIDSFPSVNSISSNQLKVYKKLILRKEYLQKKINQMLNKRTDIIGNYNDKNRAWLASDMNCRKYARLESRAAYKRDLALYRSGFILKKPIPPLIQSIKSYISEKFLNPIFSKIPFIKKQLNTNLESIKKKSPIYQGLQKSQNYIHNDLPISITKAAISGTKKCIVSYRRFSNYLHSFKRSISTSSPIRTLSYILNQAKLEADSNSNPNQIHNPFLSRIKVNPQTFEYFDKQIQQTGYYGTGRPIISNSSTSYLSHSKSFGAR